MDIDPKIPELRKKTEKQRDAIIVYNVLWALLCIVLTCLLFNNVFKFRAMVRQKDQFLDISRSLEDERNNYRDYFNEFRKQAVERGDADWIVTDKTTGKTTFVWRAKIRVVKKGQ